ALVVVTRLGPRLDGTIAKRSVGIRNHERLVVLENRTESIATRTCAARIVEREQLRSGSGQARAVVGTLEAIRESEPSDHLAIQRRAHRCGEHYHHVAVTFAERCADRFREAA